MQKSMREVFFLLLGISSFFTGSCLRMLRCRVDLGPIAVSLSKNNSLEAKLR
jgi:hypothetical protein